LLPLRLALLAPCTAGPGRLALRQERPKLFAVAESPAFAIADPLDEPGHFPAALHTAAVDANDVAVQGLAFPGSRRAQAQDTGPPVTDRIQIEIRVRREVRGTRYEALGLERFRLAPHASPLTIFQGVSHSHSMSSQATRSVTAT
jgi:hypothetical protein